jgi:hypothetical protein
MWIALILYPPGGHCSRKGNFKMGIENLGNDEREFLKVFFANAVRRTDVPVDFIEPGEAWVVGELSTVFREAQKAVTSGTLDDVNKRLEDITNTLDKVSDYKTFQGQVKDRLRSLQDTAFRMTFPEQTAGLGSYQNGIFQFKKTG